MLAINESPAHIGVEARPYLPYNPQTTSTVQEAQPMNMGPSMIGRYTPSQYSPVANQFPSLLSPQPMNNYSGNYGVNRFTGLLGSPLNFNAPTGTMPSYSTNTYQPQQFTQPTDTYKMGSLLYGSNNPLFNFIGRDMMSQNPTGNYTFTKA
jgi:hypothetical protein